MRKLVLAILLFAGWGHLCSELADRPGVRRIQDQAARAIALQIRMMRGEVLPTTPPNEALRPAPPEY
jgi:hypothetical protein